MRSNTGMGENFSTNKSIKDNYSDEEEEEIKLDVKVEEPSHRNKIV